MSAVPKSLTHRVVEGAMWMVFLRTAIRVLGVLSTVILARLLTPSDFGVVALATLVAGIVETMMQFGFDTFLIRKKDEPTPQHYGTLWTLSVLRGVVIAVALALLAKPGAVYFSEPRLELLINVLAASALIEGFQNVFIVQYQRSLNFRFEFWFQVAKKVVMLLTTITLAALYQTYWALMAGIVVSRCFGVIFSYVACRQRPRFSLVEIGEMFSFSKWIVLTNIVFYARNNADQFLIGRLLAPGALGAYLLAKEISELPTTELVYPIQRALLPGFSRLADNLAAMRAAYLRAFSTILQIGAPIGIGLALVAEPLVNVVLGPKWTTAIPILQILAVYGAIRVAYTAAGAVYLALGKPRIDGLVALATFIVGLPALWFAVSTYGVEGAAYGVLFMTAVGVPLHLAVVGRLLKLSVLDFLAVTWRTLLALAIMAATVLLLRQHADWPPGAIGPWIELLALSTAGAVTYVVAVTALWALSGYPKSCEQELLRFVKAAIFPGAGVKQSPA